MTNKVVVFSTCGSAEEAETLARQLLEARLAACVTVLTQAQSYYWWKGKIEHSAECILMIKTSRELFGQLRLKLEASHSYQVPEVLALPVTAGSPHYLAWLDSELPAGTDA
jgi:periplasmic divalent cation tolerance protein